MPHLHILYNKNMVNVKMYTIWTYETCVDFRLPTNKTSNPYNFCRWCPKDVFFDALNSSWPWKLKTNVSFFIVIIEFMLNTYNVSFRHTYLTSLFVIDVKANATWLSYVILHIMLRINVIHYVFMVHFSYHFCTIEKEEENSPSMVYIHNLTYMGRWFPFYPLLT